MSGRRAKASRAGAAKKKPAGAAEAAMSVEAYQHAGDKRKNIPTEALKEIALKRHGFHDMKRWKRDAVKDPQLVWGGKFAPEVPEKGDDALAVPNAGLRIIEKINPMAIVDNVRRYARGDTEPLVDLFGRNFNGLPPELADRMDFYKHEGDWQNRMILGDSLQVMNSLLNKEDLAGKAQMFYIDPPYGINFNSNMQPDARHRNVKNDAKGVAQDPMVVKAFGDTWECGVHSYLSYLRDRLFLARELLADSGSCFVQIGDENVHLVRCLMDEVFGYKNFVSMISYTTTSGFTSNTLSRAGDYILWYAKERETMKYRQLFVPQKDPLSDKKTKYDQIELPDGTRRALTAQEKRGELKLPDGARLYRKGAIDSQGSGSVETPFEFEGQIFLPPSGRHWTARWPSGMDELKKQNRIVVLGNRLSYVRYFDDFPWQPIHNLWTDVGGGVQSRSDPKIYVVQTGVLPIQRCMLMVTAPGDLVIDPTCGSGTTAFVAEQWGRRWITADTSRVALALARTRLMAAKYPAYILADSIEGRKKKAERIDRKQSGKTPPMENARIKFVYQCASHTTLESIASDKSPETEILYDRPFENTKRVRVCGAFTVEALLTRSQIERIEGAGEVASSECWDLGTLHGFAAEMLRQLRKAGIRGKTKEKCVKFSDLEPREGGVLVYAEGNTAGPKPMRAAVAFAPEFSPIDSQFLEAAVKEIGYGKHHDTLYICGFAAESDVPDRCQKYADLIVRVVQLNAELHMADRLKTTGSANLFSLFGAPDIVIRKRENGAVKVHENDEWRNERSGEAKKQGWASLKEGEGQVILRGIDVFDPDAPKIVRSSEKDKIACWFIDTDYDQESFFVRHAYFVDAGGKKGAYSQLKRALRADIDEDAWSILLGLKSQVFRLPKSKSVGGVKIPGKIAMRAISHDGDEVTCEREV